MNFIYQAMFYLLSLLNELVGSYGLSIILLTVLVRAVLWPLNSAQTRSMRKQQALMPKLKALQDKHKDNPQKMQEAMMKFYAENSFNPLAGCLPLLVQLPIFIGLYGMLNSPHFLAEAGNERFLFINSLSHTLSGHSGQPLDGTFNVQKDDTFTTDHAVTLIMNNGQRQEQEVKDQNNTITLFPKPILPGSPVTMRLDWQALGLSSDYKNLVKSAETLVINTKSRELEKVTFENRDGLLTQQVQTVAGKNHMNTDVLILIVIYGILTVGYQKVMTGRQPKPTPGEASDPATAAMQSPMMKLMPLMFVVMLFFIPIPAGVMIYLVITTALMLIQTVWVNFQEDRKDAATHKPSEEIVDIKANKA